MPAAVIPAVVAAVGSAAGQIAIGATLAAIAKAALVSFVVTAATGSGPRQLTPKPRCGGAA